jgi:hypothetical protein
MISLSFQQSNEEKTMQGKLLHKMLAGVIHAKRLVTLSFFVLATIKTKKLSLTNLGRSADFDIQERSAIRRADRFLGNEYLHAERKAIYQKAIQQLVGNKPNPNIIVDWSPVPNAKYHILRAALMADGRALTLYEEVYPEKKLGNAEVQKKFLITLKSLLPTNCKAIVVADAGFHNDWFSEVVAQGWDYIGRIRTGKKYQLKSNEWKLIDNLLQGGTQEPEYIGKVYLCRTNPLKTNLYRIKSQLRGREALNKNKEKKRCSHSKEYSKSGREAWVLATSLRHETYTARKVVKIYKHRMQIEEAFRDLKSHKYGFSFDDSYSRSVKRIEILLLIAMLAAFMAYLIGYVAENKKLQYQFQANSIKKHRVLSLFYLGCQVIRRKISFLSSELEAALTSIGEDLISSQENQYV